MSNIQYDSNKLLLKGIKNRDYTLICQALELGGAKNNKTPESNALFLKSWNEIISLGDMGIVEHIYNAYPFKPSYDLKILLISIIVKNKESFDFFLNKCVKNNVDLNHKFGILLSNACKISPLTTYEEDFKQQYISDYFIKTLLEHNVDLEATNKHPLVLLSANNNFHSWKLLFNHIKEKDGYNFSTLTTPIVNSLYQFLDQHPFLSEEVQYFFNNFDKKQTLSYGLKKISNPSYKGNDLSVFCMEMFSQEPELFMLKSKQLGKNNPYFTEKIQKINLFDKLNEKLVVKNQKVKGIKI